jgi:tripartite-type tricarboxylate transporter receptor subunit TctC
MKTAATVASAIRVCSLLALMAVTAAAGAGEAAYPTRPLRIIVTTAAGGGPDLLARLIGLKLTQAMGQQVVVDIRAGASGIIGAELAATASPDGYTFLMATGQHSIVQGLYAGRLKYHLAKDFAPIILLGTTPFLLVVHPAVAATSTPQLVALAKARPGVLRYGSGGAGSPPHLAAEVFKSMTASNLLHIPYKGIVPAMNDVIAGHIDVAFSAIAAALPIVKAERLRALGISSARRSPLLPELPTIGESVQGYEFVGWYGLVAPARTPAAIINRVNAVLAKAVAAPDFQERMADLGAVAVDPAATGANQFAEFMREHMERMRRAIADSGARPD